MSSYFDNKDLFLGPKTNQYGSHMVMTDVMKELKTKFVNVDTRFRDEYNYKTTSDYNITLPERFTEVRSISVTNVEIPMTYYNVSESLGNNAMAITGAGPVTRTIVIPDGNYTQTTMVSALTAQLTVAGSPFTNLTFAIPNNFTTITPSSDTFTVNFDVDASGNFVKYNFKSRLGWLLGFRNQSYTFGSKLTSTTFANLSGPRYLYLVVDEFTGSGNQKSFVSPLHASTINKNILARIPINNTLYPYMSVFPVNRSNGLISDTRSYTGKVDIQKLNVQLINEYGSPMNLNGADFSFCMCLEHE
jgi:hypothetical protein